MKNTTGLYKHQRDNRGRRRKMPAAGKACTLVPIDRYDYEKAREKNAMTSTCIGCGCDDNHACDGGCWWVRLNREAKLGVCSECPEHVEAWDRGDCTVHAEPAAEREAIAEGLIRIVSPERPKPANGCGILHDWPFEDVRDADQCRHCGISFVRHIFTEMP